MGTNLCCFCKGLSGNDSSKVRVFEVPLNHYEHLWPHRTSNSKLQWDAPLKLIIEPGNFERSYFTPFLQLCPNTPSPRLYWGEKDSDWKDFRFRLYHAIKTIRRAVSITHICFKKTAHQLSWPVRTFNVIAWNIHSLFECWHLYAFCMYPAMQVCQCHQDLDFFSTWR